MSNVTLHLDNYQFYPGNVVRGTGVCHFRSSKEVRKIRIRLKGEESTHWMGTESYYDSVAKRQKTRSVSYHGQRDFLLRDNIVHGEGTMSAGEHIFPFEFFLPEDLPGSFLHSYGRIRFTVNLSVDIPWKIDYTSNHEITIISPIKLQMLSPNLRQPAEYSDEKTICCFCCASGPVQLDVSLENRAFVVGENAGIKVYCVNMSNTNVESVNAEIKMELTFRTRHPKSDYKYDSELVTTSHNSGVGAHGEKTFNLRLEIPPLTVVPNFSGCELFSCETQLKVSAGISGCHTDLNISTDVGLGHIPYQQALPVIAHYEQSAPPYPTNGIQPMPMPMPMPIPGYKAEANKAVGLPPYPVPDYSPGPSAPREIGAPSAPLKLDLGGIPTDSGAGNTSVHELPPPTYDEAAKNF